MVDGVNSLRGHFHFLLAVVHLLLCLGSPTNTAEDDTDPPIEFLALGRGRCLCLGLVWRWLDGRGQGMSIHSGASSLKCVLVFLKRGATGSTPVSLLLLSLGRCKLRCGHRGSCRRGQLEGRAA